MAKKTNWMNSNGGFVLINTIIAVVVVIVVVLTVILSLRHYTQHGEEVVVPSITSLYLEEANIVAASEGLKIEVIDSTYSKKTELGTIVEQNPKAGAKVKNGRTIYVIQNARFRRPVILPELRDLSLRQAETTISTLGLTIKEIIYEPSAYKNILLDIRHNDLAVEAGARLEEGDAITLVVGKGQGTREVCVPNIIGKNLDEARTWLLANSLSLGGIEYDVPPTEETQTQYIVYHQSPESGTIIVEGSNVNIKLSTDIEKTIATTEEEEEDFF
jgi:beta-lactam-binding protein with PASTA domain